LIWAVLDTNVDRHLLDVGEFAGSQITTPVEFLSRLPG
jgi:hypothetical protein